MAIKTRKQGLKLKRLHIFAINNKILKQDPLKRGLKLTIFASIRYEIEENRFFILLDSNVLLYNTAFFTIASEF
ncbi:hypothetical protein EO98_07435 [Methanosarcina sp. 2.H.T.1A.6]|nr:hypothetical protein EO97_00630 [Methanosarcina sp. 2.H.T.1A.15]KKG18994.1 hypothetical protein EO94_15040 [Methanosarcina sp. 2.H.T.1A.3]KKG21549.1 hypothetical protein EO98_07435 [Methanosarcina sp. 2.H.T.1A.6]KKG21592.1 hypothetical protein EO96_11830 [Methanosarcina sp. 2.H.T.1A.8]